MIYVAKRTRMRGEMRGNLYVLPHHDGYKKKTISTWEKPIGCVREKCHLDINQI